MNWKNLDCGHGWKVGDFIFDGETLTTLSLSGREKIDKGVDVLALPEYSDTGEKVETVGTTAFANIQQKSLHIEDWKNIKYVEQFAFYNAGLVEIPPIHDLWLIHYNAFAANKLTHIECDSENYDTPEVQAGAFANNLLRDFPLMFDSDGSSIAYSHIFEGNPFFR